MRIGAHVSSAGGLLAAIERADAIGATVLQVHTQSPRAWRQNDYSPELLARFAEAVAAHPRITTAICHASYLINLGASDQVLFARSLGCLTTTLEVATGMGADGVVVHLGSHRGEGLEAVLAQVADAVIRALDDAEAHLGRSPCRLLMENAAGAGGTIGRSFTELAAVLEAGGDDERVGICLDTQHLFASGISYESLAEADGVVRSLDTEVGLARLGCLHLNDSKVPLGSLRDRHENLGEGEIGCHALGSLLGHPDLQGLPAVLEVPGRERKGPRAGDIAAAVAIHAAGVRRWKARLSRERARRQSACAPATPPPRRAPRRAQGGRRGSQRGR